MSFSGSRSSAAVFAICWCALGQTPSGRKLPADVGALVDRAGAMPVEFRVDVLFRLIDAGKIADPGTERDILESLFAAAPQAEYPMPMWDAGSHTDTRSWAVASGLSLDLDALSIRCRVVKRMLRRDPARARELFLEIAQPSLDDPGCEADLVPNAAVLYDTARELIDHSFTAAQRSEGEAVQFFEPYLQAMAASPQIPAAARAIRSMDANAAQRQKAMNIFASRLAAISDGDRAFSATLQRLNSANELVQLAVESRNQGSAVDGLLSAYRIFLVKHLTGERCADSSAQGASQAVAQFNERLRFAGYLAKADLDAITAGEGQPAKLGAKARIVNYWQTPEAHRLLLGIKHLRFGDGPQPLPSERKQTVEWQNEVRQFLSDLANWNPKDEVSPADYFHERAILYAGLIDLIPGGALRDSVVQSSLAFLSQNPMEMENPSQFLSHLNALVDQGRKLAGGVEIVEAMRNAKDPVISLYANLEKIAPPH